MLQSQDQTPAHWEQQQTTQIAQPMAHQRITHLIPKHGCLLIHPKGPGVGPGAILSF